MFFPDARANAAMRSFGLLLYEMVIETWGTWPSHPEGIFPSSYGPPSPIFGTSRERSPNGAAGLQRLKRVRNPPCGSRRPCLARDRQARGLPPNGASLLAGGAGVMSKRVTNMRWREGFRETFL